MKSLPATLGIPAELDVLSAVMKSDGREQLLAKSRVMIAGLAHNLGWMLTSPMPKEDYLVAVSLREACEAALVFIDSEPAWNAEAGSGAKPEEKAAGS